MLDHCTVFCNDMVPRMNSCQRVTKHGSLALCFGIVMIVAGSGSRLGGQVVNGDFSAGLSNWTVLRLPDGLPVGGSLTSVDIDGRPLRFSHAYYCQPGFLIGRALQQTVLLTKDVTYDFRADLAEESGSNNGDGGTLSVYLDSTLVTSYAFGYVPWHVLEYTNLVGTYTPATTGTQTLAITFTRPWEIAPDTPYDYIDNIQLTAEPCSLACPSNMVVATDPGQCGAMVNFALAAPIGECSNAVVASTPPSGTFLPVGTNVISCSGEAGHTCSFTITVEDREAPLVDCRAGFNPSGKNVPGRGDNLEIGQGNEGFYQLLAKDNCDSNPAIYVADSASSFIAGPFQNGDVVKIVRSHGGVRVQRPGPRGIAARIQLKGRAVIFGIDASGNVGAGVGCNEQER
jgi:hypothetical protein